MLLRDAGNRKALPNSRILLRPNHHNNPRIMTQNNIFRNSYCYIKVQRTDPKNITCIHIPPIFLASISQPLHYLRGSVVLHNTFLISWMSDSKCNNQWFVLSMSLIVLHTAYAAGNSEIHNRWTVRVLFLIAKMFLSIHRCGNQFSDESLGWHDVFMIFILPN